MAVALSHFTCPSSRLAERFLPFVFLMLGTSLQHIQGFSRRVQYVNAFPPFDQSAVFAGSHDEHGQLVVHAHVCYRIL